MGALDVEQLLEPVSAESPCGENLEYDAEFGELERAAQPVADQQFGETVIEGRQPDWDAVRDMAVALFPRTKDLRVAVLLARAAVRTGGLPAFRDALAVIRGLVERHWDGVHPRLEPEDDHDPTLRVNTLLALCNHEATLQAVFDAPLILSAALGNSSYRDYLVASGELPPPAEGPPPEMSNIEAALMNEDGDELVQRTETLRGAIDDVQAVENAVTEAVGVARSASFEPIVEPLTKMWRLLATYVERRGLAVAAEEAAEEPAAAEAEFAATDEEAALGSTDDVLDRDLTPPAPALDDVRSRDDVIRLLDKICEYYQEHEPSSPVPLLLNRAKRVATMSFLELLRELAPAGLEQAEALGGATDGMGGATDEAIE